MLERSGIITFLGTPMILIGPDVKVGDPIGDFTVQANDLSPVSRNDLLGKKLLFNVVPSLDTGVCRAQTKRLNEALESLPASAEVVTVSADLPFAQARFAQAEAITHRILSDHRDFSFAEALGIGIKELRLLARAIFVVDPAGIVLYRQIVSEVSHHPIYEPALTLLR